MPSEPLETHVTWYGDSYFRGEPGILRLDGDEISFISSREGVGFRMEASEIKEFNVFTNNNYLIRSGLSLFGNDWLIIPRQHVDVRLDFFKRGYHPRDDNYKDWVTALNALGVSTHSDTRSVLLIMALCFLPIILIVLLTLLKGSS